MARDVVLLVLTPLLVVLYTQLGLSNVVVDEIVDVVPAEAVAGFTALLPCDLSPPVADDKVHLVIWYKDSIDLPIYSYDARGTAPEKGTHWAADSSLGERAYFRYKDDPSRLELRHIREGDAGLYRCRVDFRKSPTRNSKVNLTIILPPQKLSVLDERGSHIQHYILGPYTEGASMEITCLSTGGRPLPKVTWWQENALLDDSYETLSERRVRNVLRLDRLERRHLHTVFTCQAANNNLVAPISSAVTLDLYLDPMWVRLLGQNRPMSADQSYEVTCEVVGARPSPIITWWKGNQPMRNARESVVGVDGNVTVSTLKLTPTLDDAGEELICRATTPPAERNVLQDSWTLNIYHVPIVYLELLGRSNVSIVKEGVDIVMECRIKSNPWVYRISWRHNGKTLFHNASAGTLITNQTLTLVNITRARSGIYTCMGSNQEGDGESNAIVLDVKFPKQTFYEVLRVKRSANPDQKSKRRKKSREAKEAEMEELSRKKDDFLKDLTLTMLNKRENLARITKDQEKSEVWREERRKRLTASNFGMVCTTKEDKGKLKTHAVYDILYNNVENACTRHGLSTQHRALMALREKHGVRGRRSGVFIDKELPYLAATPDGLVGDDAIIEVKCPLRAGEFKSAKLAARNGAVPYLSALNNGTAWLKRRSLYYYQIQGQLHITGRSKCHFFVFTDRWSHYEVILRDDQFWQDKMVNRLKRFYLDCLLPEIVDPHYPARNNTEDIGIRDSDFISNALKKAQVKKTYPRTSPEEREKIIRQFENITLMMKK